MADLHVLAGTSLIVTETFAVGGVASDIDSGVPTLAVAKPDGTAYTPTPTVSNSWTGRTTGQYRFVLPAQPNPYKLTYTLAGPIGGFTQTLPGKVEWLGALLFTLSDLRDYQLPGSAGTPFDDLVKYPDAKLQQVRAATLARFTRALGFSPVSRFFREVHSVGSWGDVVLKELYATDVLSVTVSGVAAAATGFYVDPGGRLIPVASYLRSYWPATGLGNVTVEYVAGRDLTDDDGRNVALTYAASLLNPSAFSSGTSYTTPDGVSVTYPPAEISRSGFRRFTRVPEVDNWLNLHAEAPLGVA